jgi:peptide chain release factor 2
MVVDSLRRIDRTLKDTTELFELARGEDDDATLVALERDAAGVAGAVDDLEFRRMFHNPMDPNACFIDIQAGSGGTEAQDWAAMLLRMYLRYCERRGYRTEILEESPGEVAGIKSASVKVTGDYAFGYLRTETGVHRLVRKSPFDSNARRHTSFASVFVYPEVDETIEVEINPADIRIDTFRASGAGGQHINKTDSAVRITHLPTNIVVQCQNDRSQHRNRAEAMAMLKSRLYELELRNRQAEQQKLEDAKTDIGWGHQIRSYVLDQSRIKDLRTNVEVGNTQAVLDGNLDQFIAASLKQGV